MSSRFTFTRNLRPLGTMPPVLPPVPPAYQWGVVWWFKGGIARFTTEPIYVSRTYEDACKCLESIGWEDRKFHKIKVKQILQCDMYMEDDEPLQLMDSVLDTWEGGLG